MTEEIISSEFHIDRVADKATKAWLREAAVAVRHGHTVWLTNRGKRVAAIVSTDIAGDIAALYDPWGDHVHYVEWRDPDDLPRWTPCPDGAACTAHGTPGERAALNACAGETRQAENLRLMHFPGRPSFYPYGAEARPSRD